MTKSKKIYASVSNSSGFTYLETLFSLSVISLIAFILPATFGVFSQFGMIDTDLDGDIFIMDIIETSKSSESVEKSDRDSIVFQTERGKIEYQLNNARIIKSINNEGFITMLFDVTTWNIIDEKRFIKLKIKTNGELDEEIIIRK
ncbi:competence type IV pilus minor pilin ComGF [Lacicoccus qingdaonensis]|uniref:competence type IV pilus minor pilin ComGF n=1 Tax=Lacicoccus qingdaonensis TaxID=576118 RepID=UPI0015A3DFF7|nr:competence type IV pilus minor pilin ComGF [Salinicoccus qingdaonensis]